MFTTVRRTLRLRKPGSSGKSVAAVGAGLLLLALTACGSTIPASKGTNYDAMALGTPVAQARSVGNFVLIWELNGTPTHTPTPNPTDVAVWATINAKTPTVPPLSTLPPVDASAANSAQATPVPDHADGGHTDHSGDTAPAAPAAAGSGDAANGKAIFNGAGGCFACHDTQSGSTVVGPSLKGIGEHAKNHVKPEQSIEDYLHESIVSPSAVVMAGFPDGIMPKNFSQVLNAQQINDVVAYLLTLK